MWIVRLALRNPYSMAVLALLIFILGILSLQFMLVDVLPIVDLPVVGVIWNYPGLSPEEVERRIVTINERALSTTVSGISKIESQSIPGTANIRVYFFPGTPIGSALAQVSATCQTILRILPPGITPPNVLPFNASNVPVAQLTMSSDTVPEEKLYDYGLNFVRVQLFTIPGLSTPAPYGGKTRQIIIDVDPALAQSKGISPQDVVNTLQASNLIIPAGSSRMGPIDYNILMNSSPTRVEEFNPMPIKVINGRTVTIGHVAHVADSYLDQTNIVRVNGKRATFLNILKKADASTLTVVNSLRQKLGVIQATAPTGMNFKVDFDQSSFVRASIHSVLREGVIAAILVSLMILLFLGNWRSVIIVCTSIPLSILVGIIGLSLTGESINIMTLGGLSLAIGMLVDDATVEVENINRNLPQAPSATVAILRGAHQIALPAIVSTLAICIVFFPIVLLTGPAKFLFTPLAKGVVFSMLASYVLSRTLVPVLANLLLKKTDHQTFAFHQKFEALFDRFHARYENYLRHLLEHPGFFISLFAGLFGVSLLIPLLVIGTDFFPSTDAGILKLHFRAPVGTRIEETEKLIEQVEARIREIIPKDELQTINSMIGVPTFYNLSFVPTDNVGPMDAEVLIALHEHHHPSQLYAKKIRTDLKEHFPGSSVYFQSADIVSQVLNFGLTSPIDVQIASKDYPKALEYAQILLNKIRLIPGASDVTLKQALDYPTLMVEVDRNRAAQIGLSQRDVASSLLIALSSSSLVSPSYYINPENGVNYTVTVKVPLAKIQSTQDLSSTPITSAAALVLNQQVDINTPFQSAPSAPAQTLGNLSAIHTLTTPNQISHSNVQRILNVTASAEGRELGSVVDDIQNEIKKLGKLPPGTNITVEGQSTVMRESFQKLGLGMFLAVALVYLLMVTLFQSWLDPFIIMAAVPGALIGILWILTLTHTSINVVSLMGSIMSIGIAVSNSNLLVTFANEIRIEQGVSVKDAALQAGLTRLRPVLMTALAMILGMIPMALGLGEGGEQNAPLGIAVIGGLIVSTVSTLLIIPILYSKFRTKLPSKFVLQEHFRKEESYFDQELRNAKPMAAE